MAKAAARARTQRAGGDAGRGGLRLAAARAKAYATPAAAAALGLLLVAAPLAARGQTPAAQPTPLHPVKAVAVHRETLHIGPDTTSATVGTVQPGQEVAILKLAHGYAQVFAGRTGWMPNRGIVLLTDPQAPEVIYGAAADLQEQAEQYSGQETAAKNAARLYYQVYEEFPQSYRAGEALYRAAQIQWQLDMAELPATGNNADYQLPSTRLLRQVVSKFPKTQWAARAAYLRVREQMSCSDWEGQPKCLGKEIGRLRKYWKKYPDGPLAAEAAYGILYREAAGVNIYSHPGPHQDRGKAQDYERKAFNAIADLQRRWPRSDWAARAALVGYDLREHIAVGVRHAEQPEVNPQ